jgi:hypothetical protein
MWFSVPKSIPHIPAHVYRVVSDNLSRLSFNGRLIYINNRSDVTYKTSQYNTHVTIMLHAYLPGRRVHDNRYCRFRAGFHSTATSTTGPRGRPCDPIINSYAYHIIIYFIYIKRLERGSAPFVVLFIYFSFRLTYHVVAHICPYYLCVCVSVCACVNRMYTL